MSTTRFLTIALGTAALAAMPVLAADEAVGAIPSVKQGIATGITALIVFALAAAFMGVVVWPKISKALDDRERKIRDEIESAELAREQAKEALQQYEKSLAQARAEAQKMLDDAKVQQQAIAADLKAKADKDLGELRERARRDIDAAKRAAVGEIYEQASSLASSMAAKILAREVQVHPGDQQRLVEDSVRELSLAGRN